MGQLSTGVNGARGSSATDTGVSIVRNTGSTDAGRHVFFTVNTYRRQRILTEPRVYAALKMAIQQVKTATPF